MEEKRLQEQETGGLVVTESPPGPRSGPAQGTANLP